MNLTKTEIENILSSWNLGKLISYKKATKGIVSHNWVVKTSKGQFILRKTHKYYKRKNLNFELKYLQKLKKAGFPYEIPAPILTRSKSKFIKNKNGFFWVYKFIEGDFVEDNDKKQVSEIALMVAKYHNFLEKNKLDNGMSIPRVFRRNTFLNDIKEYIGNMPKIKDKKDNVFIEGSKKLVPLLKELDGRVYRSLKKYPIHADLNVENLLWKKNKLVGIIDFENVGHLNDVLLRDLVIVIMFSCSSNERIDLGKAKYFLKEYMKYRTLSRDEIRIIPDMIVVTYIDFFVFSYWVFVHDPKRAKLKYLKENSSAALWHYKNKENILKVLNSVLV